MNVLPLDDIWHSVEHIVNSPVSGLDTHEYNHKISKGSRELFSFLGVSSNFFYSRGRAVVVHHGRETEDRDFYFGHQLPVPTRKVTRHSAQQLPLIIFY